MTSEEGSIPGGPRERRTADLEARLAYNLRFVYDEQTAARTAASLRDLVEGFAVERRTPAAAAVPEVDEQQVVLITYPDQVHEPGRAPLATLRSFLHDHLDGLRPTVHLLPVHPWTSDDGFAVADYTHVDPALGTWADVEAFRPEFGLMLDAVVNHVSAAHPWVTRWRDGDPDYAMFVRTADPADDLAAVVRPRTQPLLTAMETARGTEHVWTTFSADQVDLDYREPRVLIAVTGVLLDYLRHGATMLRLDAVAFLWKMAGTGCIHEPQTHAIVRLWRTVVDAVAPGTLIVTETNVPQGENLAYLGRGDDQAHVVYQFALSPLVLSAFTSGDARSLVRWAESLPEMAGGTTVLNILGSHDGIGLRPAQGLLPPQEIARLVDRVRAHGGAVSFRALPDGGVAPYELNSVYYDALNAPEDPEDLAIARFMAAHSVMLAMAGIPALYIHALIGSRNWVEGRHRTGLHRAVNRQKLARRALEAELADPTSLRSRVLEALRERIAVRCAEPAFHPRAAQRILSAPEEVFAVERSTVDGRSRVVCLHNTADHDVELAVDGLPGGAQVDDLCGGDPIAAGTDGVARVTLPPYGVRWLRAQPVE
jgi:glucosylglycerate phosphorylase